jgi:gliding motility-associated-like protein
MLTGTGGGNYSWSPGGSLSCTNCTNPIATPSVTTTYTLTVSDSLGCTRTDTVTIFVDIICGDVFVPNAFSPNGDGQNDVLFCRVDPLCVSDFEFIVFNRWGEVVFRTTDPSVGWDGIHRGVKCETAVFTWMAKGVFVSGDPLESSGNVSLIR